MREDCVCCRTEFIVTASCDGHVKFWKKQPEGIEFVKHIRAHMSRWWIVKLHPKPHPLIVGKIESMAASCNGFLLSTTSDDKSLKIFDVINFGKKLQQQFCSNTLLCSHSYFAALTLSSSLSLLSLAHSSSRDYSLTNLSLSHSLCANHMRHYVAMHVASLVRGS